MAKIVSEQVVVREHKQFPSLISFYGPRLDLGDGMIRLEHAGIYTDDGTAVDPALLPEPQVRDIASDIGKSYAIGGVAVTGAMVMEWLGRYYDEVAL
jgi:hypothetical protein